MLGSYKIVVEALCFLPGKGKRPLRRFIKSAHVMAKRPDRLIVRQSQAQQVLHNAGQRSLLAVGNQFQPVVQLRWNLDTLAIFARWHKTNPFATLLNNRIADTEELLAALTESRPRLRPWLGFHERILSLEAARDHLARDHLARDEEQWEARIGLDYGLRLHPRGMLVGELHIHTIDWNIPSFTLGYWLRFGYEGKGYMAEALSIAVDYLFTGLQASGSPCSATCATPEAPQWLSVWAFASKADCATRNAPMMAFSPIR